MGEQTTKPGDIGQRPSLEEEKKKLTNNYQRLCLVDQKR